MDTKKALKAFDALSQETRLKAFRYLAEAGREGLPAGVLADKLKVPHNTLSFHLANLSQASLVASKRKGRSIIYHANLDKVHALTQFMVERVCVVDFMAVEKTPDAEEEVVIELEETPIEKEVVVEKSDSVKKEAKAKKPRKPRKVKVTVDVVKKSSKEVTSKKKTKGDAGQMSMF